MARYLIEVKDEIAPFLERFAKGHGVTVEKWISVWLETSTYQAAAMTDEEAVVSLGDERTRASLEYLLRRIEDGKET